MSNKREHLIGACPAPDTDVVNAFIHVVQQSKHRFDGKGVVVRTPPPERDIYLHLRLSTEHEIASISLKQYFGFAIDARLLLESGNLRLGALSLLEGIIRRLVRDNSAIKYYGLKITCFADNAEISEDDCSKLYNFLSDWCERLGKELRLSVIHELAQDQYEFDHIMLNEHRRMVHGDIKHQYEPLAASPWI